MLLELNVCEIGKRLALGRKKKCFTSKSERMNKKNMPDTFLNHHGKRYSFYEIASCIPNLRTLYALGLNKEKRFKLVQEEIIYRLEKIK